MGQDGQKMAGGTNQWAKNQQQLKNGTPSNVIPYYQHQIKYLEGVFDSLDTKKLKYIEMGQIDQIFFMKQHPLYQRIRTLFQEEIKKLKVKKISFDIMLHLLTPFHIMTDIETKYKYLFRLYDWDKDFKLSQEDVLRTFQIMFIGQEGGNNYGSMVYNKDALQLMANEAVLRYGIKGEIKFENFRQFLPENQVKEVMSMRFNGVQ